MGYPCRSAKKGGVHAWELAWCARHHHMPRALVAVLPTCPHPMTQAARRRGPGASSAPARPRGGMALLVLDPSSMPRRPDLFDCSDKAARRAFRRQERVRGTGGGRDRRPRLAFAWIRSSYVAWCLDILRGSRACFGTKVVGDLIVWWTGGAGRRGNGRTV
jgi:hypothetical protein